MERFTFRVQDLKVDCLGSRLTAMLRKYLNSTTSKGQPPAGYDFKLASIHEARIQYAHSIYVEALLDREPTQDD